MKEQHIFGGLQRPTETDRWHTAGQGLNRFPLKKNKLSQWKLAGNVRVFYHWVCNLVNNQVWAKNWCKLPTQILIVLGWGSGLAETDWGLVFRDCFGPGELGEKWTKIKRKQVVPKKGFLISFPIFSLTLCPAYWYVRIGNLFDY
ncbi:hypothetical protein ACJMK2_023209, partial [Sinanodonta woodiana]